jgi:hypothetical protein
VSALIGVQIGTVVESCQKLLGGWVAVAECFDALVHHIWSVGLEGGLLLYFSRVIMAISYHL